MLEYPIFSHKNTQTEQKKQNTERIKLRKENRINIQIYADNHASDLKSTLISTPLGIVIKVTSLI